MSPAPARTPRKKKSSTPSWLSTIAPVLAGIALTPFAVWGASVLAMSGSHALRLLYPYVTLAQTHTSQDMNPGQAETIAQWVMYGQFPVYGLVWVLIRKLVRGSAGIFSVVMLHCVGVAGAILSAGG